MSWPHLFATWGWSAVAVLTFIVIAFIVAVRLKRNSVADVAWGLGFIAAALTGYLYDGRSSHRQTLVLTLVVFWGLRLAIHIYNRNKGKDEDYRYKELAEKGGSGLWKTFRSVFLTQGLLLLVVGLPVTVTMAWDNGTSLGWLDLIGVIIWVIGFYFETAADYQLSRFIADRSNKGKIMMSGVWKYSRHPNYFGEVAQWWGIGLIALSVPGGWFGLIGPLLISYLIIFVSGVPILEQHYQDNAAYAEYRRRTSILVPLPPKQV